MEFEVGLVYTASSRTAGRTRKTLSQRQNNNRPEILTLVEKKVEKSIQNISIYKEFLKMTTRRHRSNSKKG